MFRAAFAAGTENEKVFRNQDRLIAGLDHGVTQQLEPRTPFPLQLDVCERCVVLRLRAQQRSGEVERRITLRTQHERQEQASRSAIAVVIRVRKL